MKIVILDGERTNPGDLSWAPIAELGELTVWPHTAPEEMVPHIADNEIVIVDKPLVTRAVLDACPSIKMIGLFATGFNVVDIDAAREKGIPVCNVPGYSSWAVSQLAAALLLEICTQVGRHSEAVRAGEWKDASYFCRIAPDLTEIAGKTVGIIGYGGIGQAFGRIMKAMGATLLVHSRHPKPELADGQTRWASLDEIFSQADIISLHCPLNDDSRGMIGRDALAKMKDGVILINTARGALIDEEAVADALRAGKLRALGQDAFAVEPLRPDNPLLHAPNAWLTPHMGWAPHETRERLIGLVAGNIRGFLEGRPRNIVNGL